MQWGAGMRRAELPQLEQLLDNVAAAILAGDMARLAELSELADAASEGFALQDQAQARRIRKKAECNARLLAAAVKGVRAARRRAVELTEAGRFSTRDVLALIVAGLRGGGWRGSARDLLSAEIEGGPVEAARVAGALLARAFEVPGA